VGSHTFVLSDDIWVDTAFDPDDMQTVKVAFLSDDYFALVASYPQLGAAFALSSKVIVLSDGIAYEVVEADVSVPAIEIPEPDNPQTPVGSAATLTPAMLPDEPVITPKAEAESPAAGSSILCGGGMLPLALFPLVGLLVVRKLQKHKNRI
jgi:hypothetical protein